jgi:serine/threonine protein kinase
MEPVSDPRIYSNRYEVTHLIDRGGMALVYRAQDLLLSRAVALKILYPELSADPLFVERFRREAQAAANLSHPNIVPVFDWGEDNGTYFIVMELIDGTSLDHDLRGARTLSPSRSAVIAAQVASALGYAHRSGVVHRDVKPGNILITSDGQVKVTDFGIAQAVSSEDQFAEAGSVMGTATYFSPEQASVRPSTEEVTCTRWAWFFTKCWSGDRPLLAIRLSRFRASTSTIPCPSHRSSTRDVPATFRPS